MSPCVLGGVIERDLLELTIRSHGQGDGSWVNGADVSLCKAYLALRGRGQIKYIARVHKSNGQ